MHRPVSHFQAGTDHWEMVRPVGCDLGRAPNAWQLACTFCMTNLAPCIAAGSKKDPKGCVGRPAQALTSPIESILMQQMQMDQSHNVGSSFFPFHPPFSSFPWLYFAPKTFSKISHSSEGGSWKNPLPTDRDVSMAARLAASLSFTRALSRMVAHSLT